MSSSEGLSWAIECWNFRHSSLPHHTHLLLTHPTFRSCVVHRLLRRTFSSRSLCLWSVLVTACWR